MSTESYRLDGATVVLTGATSGIGLATAAGLAAAGADLILACRNDEGAKEVTRRLTDESGNTSIESVHLDLASLASVREAAAEIRRRRGHIDVLLNNAGIFSMKRRLTEDGFELTMGVNHLGHFLFTHELMPLLKAAARDAAPRKAAPRIINVASAAHFNGKIDFDNFFLERRYAGFRAYANSRLATVLHTKELASRLTNPKIAVNCLHPGHVATKIWSLWPQRPRLSGLLSRIIGRFLITPEEGAVTSLYLACSQEVEGVAGEYFDACRPVPAKPICSDLRLRRRLWDMSAELVGTQ